MGTQKIIHNLNIKMVSVEIFKNFPLANFHDQKFDIYIPKNKSMIEVQENKISFISFCAVNLSGHELSFKF